MMPETKKQDRNNTGVLVAAAGVLLLMLKLWPLLLLLIAGLAAYGLWKLFHIQKQPTAPNPMPLPEPTAPVSEMSILAEAFGLLQRRITEYIAVQYPYAKWVWGVSDAFGQFKAGRPLPIFLSRAGGWQKATVIAQNLQFRGLLFPSAPESAQQSKDPGEKPQEPETADYGLLAFEWVEANLQKLNEQSGEAAAAGQEDFRIPAEELPHGDGWHKICEELARNGFAAAYPRADGIHVKIKTETE